MSVPGLGLEPMENYFLVYLPGYDHVAMMNRAVFTQLFPDSVISNALTMFGPDEDQMVEIEEKAVTPQIVDLLKWMTDHQQLPTIQQIKGIHGLGSVGNYLNIPILGVIGNPRYVQISPVSRFADINLLKPETWTLMSGELMAFAIIHNYYELFDYLLPRISSHDVDWDRALLMVVNSGHDRMVNRLLVDGRANPAANQNGVFLATIEKSNADTVARLLADPRVDPNAQGGKALDIAIITHNRDVIELLLSDPRVIVSDEAINTAEFQNDPALVAQLRTKRALES